jgi:DNA-binding NtrC family response regulator
MATESPQIAEQPAGPEQSTQCPPSPPSLTEPLTDHPLTLSIPYPRSDRLPHAVTAVLVSTDASLAQTCQHILRSVSRTPLVVLGSVEKIDPFLRRETVTVIVLHVVGESDAGGVARLLHRLESLVWSPAVLVIADQYDAEEAWSFVRLGAVDYLSRPLDLGRLTELLAALAVSGRPKRIGSYGRFPSAQAVRTIAGLAHPTSTEMTRMLGQIRIVAAQDSTVLLSGETGTGKTWLARIIHKFSPRRAEPLLAIDCGALAAELIESEMFGHVKGAFTGADRTRIGKFAAAGAGTLLLDEIDALPCAVQAKLLRAVDERVFEPVGSNESMPVRARLIAASNRPLEREVEASRFRADLYYRLKVIDFYLPPLRARRGDIPGMATEFMKEFASRSGRPAQTFSAGALQALLAYRWPGNVRELRNAIERAVALCPGPQIQLGDLPEVIAAASGDHASRRNPDQRSEGLVATLPLERAREQVEIERITQALQRYGNNRLRAAAALGISRRTLYKKLHRYSLGAIKEQE